MNVATILHYLLMCFLCIIYTSSLPRCDGQHSHFSTRNFPHYLIFIVLEWKALVRIANLCSTALLNQTRSRGVFNQKRSCHRFFRRELRLGAPNIIAWAGKLEEMLFDHADMSEDVDKCDGCISIGKLARTRSDDPTLIH